MNSNVVQMSSLPTCTVILCTRQRPHALARCLASLNQLDYPRLSVLVIENDAVSSELEDIALLYGATYRLCTRRGLSAARNFGLRVASSDLVAFIDDDAVCEPDWLLRLAPLFRDERVLAATGKIVFHSDLECKSDPVYEFDPADRVVGLDTPHWFGMANFGGLGLGSNFVVRRSAFDVVGSFDERLGRGSSLHCSEENDLLFRIIDAGYSVATSSSGIVRHPVPSPENSKITFRSIAASTVMVTMLACEHPRHLHRLLRYLWGAVTREEQSWRQRPAQLFDHMASRWTVYSALLLGPFLYIQATIHQLLYGTPAFTYSPQDPQQDRLATPTVPKIRARLS